MNNLKTIENLVNAANNLLRKNERNNQLLEYINDQIKLCLEQEQDEDQPVYFVVENMFDEEDTVFEELISLTDELDTIEQETPKSTLLTEIILDLLTKIA